MAVAHHPIFLLFLVISLFIMDNGNGLPVAVAHQSVATHLVILVHGLHGNDKELDYLGDTITRQAAALTVTPNNQASKQQQVIRVIVYSSKCNLGRTSDGIIQGGNRLVQEVEQQLLLWEMNNVENGSFNPIFLSFIGNSLGGLYARYAIAHLNWSLPRQNSIVPFIFCTTFTPHLGTANHTYVPIFRWTQDIVANVLGQTGRDLFHKTPVLKELGTCRKYRSALQRFRKRMAIANAFGTDFQVPTATAAFLSSSAIDSIHYRLRDKPAYLLSVETKQTSEEDIDPNNMSLCLDALGWTKIFLDARDAIPLPSVPLLFGQDTTVPADKTLWSSLELLEFMTRRGTSWKLPLGHMVSCANSRDSFNRWINSNGRRFMDQLAMDFLEEITTSTNSNPQECDY